MARFDKIRIFIKDEKGNHYRICSVANPKVTRGEFYLKIMFPDIKGIPLVTGHHNKSEIRVGGNLPSGLQEFSYHYRSGSTHFKDSKGYVDAKKNMPTLIDNHALHLLRFVARSLDSFEIQDITKITESDFVIPQIFDARPRGFEFAISRVTGPWNVINEQGQDPILTYKISLVDQNVSLNIADSIWRRPPLHVGTTLFEIFTHDDPTEPLIVRLKNI